MKHDLESILAQPLPLLMFINSKKLFNLIASATQTAYKFLMIEIAAVREACNDFEISNFSLVAGAYNSSDALTNPNFSKGFVNILKYSKNETSISQ